jgi:hypothetical protein
VVLFFAMSACLQGVGRTDRDEPREPTGTRLLES